MSRMKTAAKGKVPNLERTILKQWVKVNKNKETYTCVSTKIIMAQKRRRDAHNMMKKDRERMDKRHAFIEPN